MKTRALILTALVSTGLLFSACTKKTETTDMPKPDTTMAPMTPSSDTTSVPAPPPPPAPAPAPAPAPSAADSAAMHKDSANMKKNGMSNDAKKDGMKKDTSAKKM